MLRFLLLGENTIPLHEPLAHLLMHSTDLLSADRDAEIPMEERLRAEGGFQSAAATI